MIKVYYHAHLTDDSVVWTSIFLEQMKCMEDSGLLKHVNEFNITAITQKDDRNEMLVQLCQSYLPVKFNIVFAKNKFDDDGDMLQYRNSPQSCTEDITLERIYDDSFKHDDKILYFHTKGTTSFATNLTPHHIVKHKQYHYWRAFMNWAVIENWQFCENALGVYDIAGGNFCSEPHPHYSGNFWWATADHIRKLPDPTNKEWWYQIQKTTTDAWIRQAPLRMSDEMWIGAREGIKAFDVINLGDKKPMNACLTKLDCERMRT